MYIRCTCRISSSHEAEEIHVHGISHVVRVLTWNSGINRGHSHLPMIMESNENDFVISSLRGLLIVLGLSVHELFEGLAIGLESSSSYVWYVRLARSIVMRDNRVQRRRRAFAAAANNPLFCLLSFSRQLSPPPVCYPINRPILEL